LAAIEIIDVSLPEKPDALDRFDISSPREGSRTNLFMLHIVGWVLGESARPLAVEILYDESLIRVAPIRVPRPDLASAYPKARDANTSGFHAVVPVPGLTPAFELRLRVVLDDGRRVPIGSIKARHEPLRPSFEPRLQPIVVTCLGRAGTTLLMRLLASHPQIVVYRRYPYEFSAGRYLAHMFKVLSEPVDINELVTRDVFPHSIWNVAYSPFYDEAIAQDPELGDWFGRSQIERMAAFFQRSIDDWYTAVARNHGQADPVYFAEKYMWPGYTPVLMRELYPAAKEIFLVRDFRDMACSILAFDGKRGFPGFRRPSGKTDHDYIREDLRDAAIRFSKSWKERGSDSHLLRYEDLALRPAEALPALLEYLQLDSGTEAVTDLLRAASEEAPDFQQHRTSRDLAASIGRWRREHDHSLQAVCQETFEDLLGEFGYSEMQT
jgi:hypothetical protein